MENTRTFEGRIDLWECVEYERESSYITAKGSTALTELAKALEAYGMGVTVERDGRYATIKIDHLQPWEAERARTRMAGRPRTKGVLWPLEAGTTNEQRLAWCESRTLDEIQAALGCSKRTAQRRLAELRAKAHGNGKSA